MILASSWATVGTRILELLLSQGAPREVKHAAVRGIGKVEIRGGEWVLSVEINIRGVQGAVKVGRVGTKHALHMRRLGSALVASYAVRVDGFAVELMPPNDSTQNAILRHRVIKARFPDMSGKGSVPCWAGILGGTPRRSM